jgi:glycerophosphoryl diester phosphodiesterase
VVEETAGRFRTPLAIPLMDLTVEKAVLLDCLGAPAAGAAAFHFRDAPGAAAVERAASSTAFPGRRLRATIDAVAHVARRDDLIAAGMAIGPFSLATKLMADPIPPVFLAGKGVTGEDDPEVRMLEEVLEAVVSRAPAHLVVEVKPVADAAAAVRTARALEAALAGAGAGTTVTVSSFDWRLLSVVRSALAGTRVRTAALGSVGAPAHLVLRGALDAGHHEAHLSLDALLRAPHAIRHARQLGVGVTAWTVNGREDLRRVAGWGVDAVITDNVVLARAALQDVPVLHDVPAVPASSLGMTAC